MPALATFFCLLIGYPMALGITRVSKSWRNLLLMLVILPFWTSFLLRVYAWMGLLGTNSWFNKGLTALVNAVLPSDRRLTLDPDDELEFRRRAGDGLFLSAFHDPAALRQSREARPTLNEAATDLGSRPWQVFKDVTLPLSMPGIVAGGLLVFIPASGELIIPSLVGNAADPMIGRVISDEFSSARDWPMASAVAVALLLVLVLPMMAYSHFERPRAGAGGGPRMNRRPVFLITCLCFGFAFFYIPILSLIVFSFNKSRLVTVWGGFSTQWYGKLLQQRPGDQGGRSVAADRRHQRHLRHHPRHHGRDCPGPLPQFRGRAGLSGLVTAPLVMPEVITGISSLMLFILMAEWIGWPGSRGFTTITIAHITFAMTYVAVIVQSRLSSMDIAIEEAAMDLGARPWQRVDGRDAAGDFARTHLRLASRFHHLAR